MSDDTAPVQVAVALQYDRETDAAPKVVASGRGLIAEQIVAVAEENGIVIEANPLLAEALSHVELDDTIPIELYEAVAAVIGFVLRQSDVPGWRANSDETAAE
jgi:flagellar biosynthesis protein